MKDPVVVRLTELEAKALARHTLNCWSASDRERAAVRRAWQRLEDAIAKRDRAKAASS